VGLSLKSPRFLSNRWGPPQSAGQGTGSSPPVNGAAASSGQSAPEFAYTAASAEIGLVCRSVTAEAGANLGLESAKGMEVVGVTSGGAANQAGIRRNDVILSIAGVPMRDLSGLSKLADNLSEPRVPVELWREGKRHVVQLYLDRLRR
jgi:serine protease Do